MLVSLCRTMLDKWPEPNGKRRMSNDGQDGNGLSFQQNIGKSADYRKTVTLMRLAILSQRSQLWLIFSRKIEGDFVKNP